LAVDDTIHMLARFREERGRHDDIREVLLATAAGSGKAIVVTSIMLGAGMSVMLISSFMPVRLFGELICVTLAGCILGDLIILPAMLVLFAKD
jgi:predicted RND superfamily exporter protein